MKPKSTLFIFLLTICMISCKDGEKKDITKEIKKEITVAKKVLDTLQSSKTKNTSWNINTSIGEGIVYRSGEENSWDNVFISNVFGLKTAPKVGDYAQIIPLRNDLSILELKITKTTKRNDVQESDSNYDWYAVDLESIKNKDYWTVESPKDIRAEYPSDVLVVYLPIKEAQLLDITKIDMNNLPKDMSKEVIKGALDFDGDSLPDALVLSFCCKNKTSKDDCEYECGETYIKVNNKWNLINSSQPL